MDDRRARSTEAEALRLLARRPLTEAELRERLERKGHAPADVDAVCAGMREAGYVDDFRCSLEFIVARTARLAHGPRKLLDQLRRRGVDPATAALALARAVESGDASPRDALMRRLRRLTPDGAPRPGTRDHARVYNALFRAGFDDRSIRDALQAAPGSGARTGPGDSLHPVTLDEIPDDFT